MIGRLAATAARIAMPLTRRALASPLVGRSLLSPMACRLAAGSSLAAAALVAAPASLSEPAPAIGLAGEAGSKRERTLILVKPDGVERGIVGGVISKFETKGYKLVGMKMVTPSLDEAKANYAGLSKLPFFPGLCAVRAFARVIPLATHVPSCCSSL